MNKVDRFIIASIIISLLVNLGSAFLDKYFPKINVIAAIILGSAILIWGVYRLSNTLLQYLRFGRYAVLVFFLNAKNELLLVKHPFHHRLIPPGGRLTQWELPHLAIAGKLREEAGIKEFEFHPKFHNPDLMISEIVEDVPRPYSVHMEYRKQRGGIKFHYAFVYVCRFRDGKDLPLVPVPEYEPRWFDLESIWKLSKEDIPFDDIVRRYEDILQVLGAKISVADSRIKKRKKPK